MGVEIKRPPSPIDMISISATSGAPLTVRPDSNKIKITSGHNVYSVSQKEFGEFLDALEELREQLRSER